MKTKRQIRIQTLEPNRRTKKVKNKTREVEKEFGRPTTRGVVYICVYIGEETEAGVFFSHRLVIRWVQTPLICAVRVTLGVRRKRCCGSHLGIRCWRYDGGASSFTSNVRLVLLENENHLDGWVSLTLQTWRRMGHESSHRRANTREFLSFFIKK